HAHQPGLAPGQALVRRDHAAAAQHGRRLRGPGEHAHLRYPPWLVRAILEARAGRWKIRRAGAGLLKPMPHAMLGPCRREGWRPRPRNARRAWGRPHARAPPGTQTAGRTAAATPGAARMVRAGADSTPADRPRCGGRHRAVGGPAADGGRMDRQGTTQTPGRSPALAWLLLATVLLAVVAALCWPQAAVRLLGGGRYVLHELPPTGFSAEEPTPAASEAARVEETRPLPRLITQADWSEPPPPDARLAVADARQRQTKPP